MSAGTYCASWNAKATTAYGPDGRYGGFYTQDDIREVVAYAAARHITASEMAALIGAHTDQPILGFIGQPHVNVLMTNRALDAAMPKAQPKPA